MPQEAFLSRAGATMYWQKWDRFTLEVTSLTVPILAVGRTQMWDPSWDRTEKQRRGP